MPNANGPAGINQQKEIKSTLPINDSNLYSKPSLKSKSIVKDPVYQSSILDTIDSKQLPNRNYN
jgi:hypothetical protein